MDRIDLANPSLLEQVARHRVTPRVRPTDSAEVLARIVPPSIHRSPAVERLVAARVAARTALESGRAPADTPAPLQLYQHPASRAEAATNLFAGRVLDVNA